MLRVAHIRDTFLRSTETFIYDIFTRHRSVKPIFLCERCDNVEQFGMQNVHSIDRLNPPGVLLQEVSRRILGEFPYYTKMCRANDIQLIHAHFAPSGYYALATQRALGIPVITSFYGQDVFEFPSNPRWKRRYRQLFSEGDLFLSLSQDMTKDLASLGCPEQKIRLYRLGIDLKDFSPVQRADTDEPTVLTVARLVEKKGIEYLIRSVQKIRGEGGRIRLRIIGDGPLLDELKAVAAERFVEAIEFAGRVPFATLPREMAVADIFCLPSVTDRFGGKDEISMVLKEAMGAALPIIATFHAGIPEVVKDGANGLLVPERNIPSLADAITRLAASRELRERIGLGGRKLVEQTWDIEHQIEVLESIYRELLGHRHVVA
jgi:colanic acid/amylovoran biosynthesis glycosyltransferase